MRTAVARLARQHAFFRRHQHTSATAATPGELLEQTSRVPLFRFPTGNRGDGSGLRITKSEDTLRRVVGYPDAHIALRDACKCPRCLDQSTRQREFDFADIPVDIQGEPTQEVDGNWHVRWTNDIPGFDDHVSVFTQEQISSLKRTTKLSSTRLWDKGTFESETSKVDYTEFMNEEEGLAKVLYLLARHGLVLVNNIPRDENSIVKLAERIGPLRNTFYGSTWNVKSVSQAKNVAYTHKHLGFHMDLIYMKEPPNIQFLHCLENSCTGGESRFVDTFKAFDILLSEDKEAGTDLLKSKVRYEYDNDGHYYSDIKPIIELAEPMESVRRQVRGHKNYSLESVRRVYWSPPFVGSIWSEYGENPDFTRRKLAASKAFAGILERPDLVYEERMEPGTCMVFDNLRVLHARNAFDINSGSRWLRGCYLDGQDVTSKELKLSRAIAQLDTQMNRAMGNVKRTK